MQRGSKGIVLPVSTSSFDIRNLHQMFQMLGQTALYAQLESGMELRLRFCGVLFQSSITVDADSAYPAVYRLGASALSSCSA